MTVLKITLLSLVGLLIVAAALGLWVNSRDKAQAARVWAALEAAREPQPPRYDPAMVADLPEIAQRYFARAIEPGTPLHRIVRLQMSARSPRTSSAASSSVPWSAARLASVRRSRAA